MERRAPSASRPTAHDPRRLTGLLRGEKGDPVSHAGPVTEKRTGGNMAHSMIPNPVIPAKAGIQSGYASRLRSRLPALAGMTDGNNVGKGARHCST